MHCNSYNSISQNEYTEEINANVSFIYSGNFVIIINYEIASVSPR